MMGEFSEIKLQAVLMRWLMVEKHHSIVVPNSTVFFNWEADVASITRAFYSHEIEIKISKGDFLKDKKKWYKHNRLATRSFHLGYCYPNYFWYATPPGFEIEVPEYAGWLLVTPIRDWYRIDVKKEAPRLHTLKVIDDKVLTAARLLSFRLMNEYVARLEKEKGK